MQVLSHEIPLMNTHFLNYALRFNIIFSIRLIAIIATVMDITTVPAFNNSDLVEQKTTPFSQEIFSDINGNISLN